MGRFEAVLKGAAETIGKMRLHRVASTMIELHRDFPAEFAQVVKSLLPPSSEPAADPSVVRMKRERICKQVGDAANDNGELRLVTGIVLEPDIIDSQGDTYTALEVRKAAHIYMADYQNVGLQHQMLVNWGVQLVESWTTKVDQVIEGSHVKAGTWLMTVFVQDDEIWKLVKDGELTGFSIGGFATKTELEAGEGIEPSPPLPADARQRTEAA